MLSTDLDVLEEVLDGFRGPVKIQLCGPWTLAATLELPRTMNVAIADPGAVADLTASLAEGAAAYAADVAKRVPGAQAGRPVRRAGAARRGGGLVPTASGLSRLAAVEADVLRERLAQVIAATQGYTVVHSCAASVPFGIIRAAGADAVVLRPQPATAGRGGRGGRVRGGGHGLADGRGTGGACPGDRSAAPAGLAGLRGIEAARPVAGDRQRRGPGDRRAGHSALAAAGPAAGDVRRAGGDHAGLRAGRRVPDAGARRVDPMPGGGEHAG